MPKGWGHQRRLQRARAYAAIAEACPTGLEVNWYGALTTTEDLAMTLASAVLEGYPARWRGAVPQGRAR